MSHKRKDIRAAILATLGSSNITAVGTRVYSNRALSLQDEERPCILIYARSEEGKRTGQQASPTDRVMRVIIEGRVEVGENGNLDDAMDDLAESIETRMNLDATLGGVSKSLFLAGTNLDTSSDSERPGGLVTMTYEVIYIA